jgi:hypothetical protein
MSKKLAAVGLLLLITSPLLAAQNRDGGDPGLRQVSPIRRLIAKVSKAVHAAVEDWTIGIPHP